MTTLKDIKTLHPDARCSQVGYKQLFEVEYPGYTLLYSYTTPIAIYKQSEKHWYFTVEKFSKTTSKQTNQYKRGLNYTDIDEATFTDMLTSIHIG